MRVNIKLGLSLLALSLLFNTAGCQVTPKEGTVNQEQVVQLNIWLTPGSGLEPLIDQYQARHPELEIHIQTSTTTQLPAKLQTSFAAGYGSLILLQLTLATWSVSNSFLNIFII